MQSIDTTNSKTQDAQQQEHETIVADSTSPSNGDVTDPTDDDWTVRDKVGVLATELKVGFDDIGKDIYGDCNNIHVEVTLRSKEFTGPEWTDGTKAIIRIPALGYYDGKGSENGSETQSDDGSQDDDASAEPESPVSTTSDASGEPESPVSTTSHTSTEPESPVSTTSDTSENSNSSEGTLVDETEGVDTDESDTDDDSDGSESSDESVDSDIASSRDYDDEYWQVLDQALLLNRLQDLGIPAPRVLAFDTTINNALEAPYSIHARVGGSRLYDAIDDEGMPLEGQIQIAEDLAEILVKMNAVKFDVAGRLLADEDQDHAAGKLPLSLSSREDIKEELTVWPFPKGKGRLQQRRRAAHTQRICHSSLYALLDESIEDLIREEQVNGARHIHTHLRQYFFLQDMLQDMDQLGWFSEADKAGVESSLWHVDLEPMSIMVDEVEGRWKVSGILGWDYAIALPSPLTRRPPIWLWHRTDPQSWLPEKTLEYDEGDEDWFPDELPYNTADSDKVKEAFEAVMVEKLYSGARDKYLDDAYGRGRWIRLLWKYAYMGCVDPAIHSRGIAALNRQWNAYKKSINFKDDDAEYMHHRVYLESVETVEPVEPVKPVEPEISVFQFEEAPVEVPNVAEIKLDDE
jgi:hypothetical protein